MPLSPTITIEQLPLTLDRLDRLAVLFDTAFLVPGTNIRFGIESLMRLVPGIGDLTASALSCYLLYEAHAWCPEARVCTIAG